MVKYITYRVLAPDAKGLVFATGCRPTLRGCSGGMRQLHAIAFYAKHG